MKKVIARLGLTEGSSDDVAEAAVIAIQNNLTTATGQVTTLTTQLAEANNKLTEANNKLIEVNNAAAETYVKQLVKDGVIDPTKEADALVQAKNNLEGFKTAFSFMPTKANNIMDVINKNSAPSGEQKETRTLRQLEKEDPKALASLKANNIAEYTKMYNAQYGTNKTEADLQ